MFEKFRERSVSLLFPIVYTEALQASGNDKLHAA